MFVFSIIIINNIGGLKMQVNAINSFSNVNFQKKYRAPKNVQQEQHREAVPQRSGISKAPLYAAFMIMPMMLPSCKYEIGAHATATALVTPDTIVGPGHTDTIPGDTIIKNDTIYIPPEFQFPYDIHDSLNFWRGEILDIDADGETPGAPKEYGNKAVLSVSGYRDWDYHKYQKAVLNLAKSDSTEARFDHTIYDPRTRTDSIRGDIRVTQVKPGDITVIRPRNDGSEEITDNVSGLLFNADGVKTFIHSNGRDKLFVYRRVNSGVDQGRYKFAGTMEPGYLEQSEFGQNVLLDGLIHHGTQDHLTDVKVRVVDVDDLRDANANDFSNIMSDL